MAQHKKTRTPQRKPRSSKARSQQPPADNSNHPDRERANSHQQGVFARAACAIAHVAGKPVAFLTATGLVIAWAVSGPLFGFSDTWQLVINTSTTIVTFLMVFLIQNTQNRDTAAIQIKLAELILRFEGADNKLAAAEDMSDEELEQLHHAYKQRAEETLQSLDQRRDPKAA